MTTFNITYNARVEATVEAENLAEAENLIRQAYGAKPPALEVNGEDVIYDFSVSNFSVAP